MKAKKLLALALALLMVMALFAGCGKTETPSAPTTTPGTSTDTPTDTPADTPDDNQGGTDAPVEDSPYKLAAGNFDKDENGIANAPFEYAQPFSTTDEVFSYWNTCYTPQYIPAEGFGSMPYQKELEELTGVHIEYLTPPAETKQENFSVLLAADDLPDVMSLGLTYYGKSAEDAINEGWFANIWDYRDYAPNYFYQVKALDQDSVTNTVYYKDGIVGWFYGILTDPTPTTGWCVREDFLEDLGLTWQDIVTYDDIHDMLFRFKNELGVEWPMEVFSGIEMVPGYFASGYNTALLLNSYGMPFSKIVDGKYAYTLTTEDDKELVTMMAQWYKEGLIDPGWPGYIGNNEMMNQITGGQTAYVSMTPSQINDYIIATPDPDCRWTSLTRPVKYEGQKLMYGQELSYLTYGNVTISAACENLPVVITWCDWFYSPFGSDYSSWGPQGVVWDYDENGQKALTDFILHNPEGMGAQWGLIMHSANNLGDATLFSQARQYAYDGGWELLEMTQRWVIEGYEGEYDIPSGFRLSDDEAEEVSSYSGDVSTYINENFALFFVGDKPITEWDAYIADIYALGLEEILAIYQPALEAYLAENA